MSDLTPTPLPAIYPTLVIGLGGAGANVARHAKHRFLRSWRAHPKSRPWDDLPDVLQVLAVDTEPLVNKMGETPLYFHEYAFLGKFDATKLVQNRHNHPYLSWWTLDDHDIPLGYVHNGAKQLRPIGRLAFFRNYVTFKRLMEEKITNMLVLPAVQEAEHRGFDVMRDHRLIFIVSSLCGGTGAGMFLDVAHRVRHQVGSNASIIGIFFMPSVFERTISSEIQKRRIRANAYAALKELEHFHETQSFKALYPSEQVELPTTPYRAFSRIFLVESTNSEKVSQSGKEAAEQMAAHLIHLMAFSPLNKDILGQEANAHASEERSTSGSHRNYSAFASAAIVLPRTAMWNYLLAAATWFSGERLRSGIVQDTTGEQKWRIYLGLRDGLKDAFRRYAVSGEELQHLDQDMTRNDGRWLAFERVLTETMQKVLQSYGLQGLEYVAHRLSRRESDSDLHHEDIGHPDQLPLERLEQPVPPTRPSWRESLLPNQTEIQRRRNEQARYEESLARFQLTERARGVWAQLLEKVRTVAEAYKTASELTLGAIADAQSLAEEQGNKAREQLDPLRPNDSAEASTIYEMETGAMREEYAGALWGHLEGLLGRPVGGDNGPTGWGTLHLRLCNIVLPPVARQPARLGVGDLDRMVRAAFSQPPLKELFARMSREFDIRSIFYIQYAQERQRAHGGVPPYFAPKQVMGSHVRPFAFADADLRPFSYADVDPIPLVSVLGDGKEAKGEVDEVFDQIMKDFGEFRQVRTGDRDRIDACYIVHGLPLELISSLPDLHTHYHGGEFPKALLHLEAKWAEELPEAYTPPGQERPTAQQTATDSGQMRPGSSASSAPPSPGVGTSTTGKPTPTSPPPTSNDL